MACFGFFSRFRRSKSAKPSTSETSHPPTASARPHRHAPEHVRPGAQPSCAFHDQAQRIAQTPVGGLRRNPGVGQTSSFIISYQPAHSKGPHAACETASNARDGRAATFETGCTEDTLVGSAMDLEKKGGYGPDANKSTWQGKPNGTAYDRREELTEEDEDMWARLAM